VHQSVRVYFAGAKHYVNIADITIKTKTNIDIMCINSTKLLHKQILAKLNINRITIIKNKMAKYNCSTKLIYKTS